MGNWLTKCINSKRALLVLGNGFDLHCGLKSSYKDYFESVRGKYDEIKAWADSCVDVVRYLNCNIMNRRDSGPKNPIPNNISIWDILFCYSSLTNERVDGVRWCDIEREMYSSLVVKDSSITDRNENDFKWGNVYNCLENVNYGVFNYSKTERICGAYIMQKRDPHYLFNTKEDFYSFLLDELNDFENRFGEYLKQECEKRSGYYVNYSDTIRRIVPVSNIKEICTFNYTQPTDYSIKRVLYNVNGDLSSPIFGICRPLQSADTYGTFKDADSFYKFNEIVFSLFCKDTRRLRINSDKVKSIERIESIYFFGQSLNEQDYALLFSELDRVNLFENNTKGKVVFLYSIFDVKRKNEIYNSFVATVGKFLSDYCKYKNRNGIESSLDYLESHGNIILADISKL